MVKLLLSLNGINEPSNKDDQRISISFHKEFLEIVKEKFPLLYRFDEEFAMNMLPETFIYDRDNNKLVHKRLRGKITELILKDIKAP